jgi:hypothetical protein
MTRALGCLVVLALAAPAHADEAKVFPLSGQSLPADLATAPEAMTNALATSIAAGVANVPIEDAAGLYDCDVETTPCLEKVSKELGARRLVFGTISRTPAGKIKVVLTRFDVGPDRVQRTYTLEGKTSRVLAEELVRVTGDLFDRPAEPTPPIEPNPEPAEPAVSPAPSPAPSDPVDPPSGPTISTYLLIGVGAVVAGIGGGYLYSASNLRDEYDRAPNETFDDIQRLRALEERGNSRLGTGRILVIGGSAILAAGIVRAIIQLPRRDDTATATLDLTPTADGASLVFTASFR